jgi:hypothetical protein
MKSTDRHENKDDPEAKGISCTNASFTDCTCIGLMSGTGNKIPGFGILRLHGSARAGEIDGDSGRWWQYRTEDLPSR